MPIWTFRQYCASGVRSIEDSWNSDGCEDRFFQMSWLRFIRAAGSRLVRRIRSRKVALCGPENVTAKQPVPRDPAVIAAFDTKYYLSAYQDVARANADPIRHYFQHGWSEGRRPRQDFDTAYYVRAHPDVVLAGMNPFEHYILKGRREGRRACPPPQAGRHRVLSTKSPRDRIPKMSGSAVPDLDTAGFDRLLRSLGSVRGIAVSLSHDEYLRSAGGIQNRIGDEATEFRANRWTYLHVCPDRPLPLLADPSEIDDFSVILTVDGSRLGIVRWSTLEHVIRTLDFGGERCLILHQLLGFPPELVVSLAKAGGFQDVFAWTHDFFSICPSYALLRNDLEFCHAPPAGSNACMICCYGQERRAHIPRVRQLYSQLHPVVVAPSETALAFWKEHAHLPFLKASVQPHCAVVFDGPVVAAPAVERPLRIAYLGGPVWHKGWDVFRSLADRYAEDGRYEFLHFGSNGGFDELIRFVPVEVTPSDRHVMTEALIREGADVAIQWSLCYETFSFTTYEAMAAGLFVVARQAAGNVWQAVCTNGTGKALDSEQELFDYLGSGRIVDDVAASGRRRGHLISEGMVAVYLRKEAAAA